jgi:cytoskeletal protein CcmA (bactofilin family)
MNNRIYSGVQRRYLSQRFSKSLGRNLLSKRFTYILIFLVALLAPVGGNTQPGQSSDDALFIDTNGRVGIGTNNPRSQLDVAGDAMVGGPLDVTGDTKVGRRLDVSGDSKVGGQLDVTGNTRLGRQLEVKGDTKVGEQLDVAGDAKVGGKLDVTGDVRVNGNISFRAFRARYQRDDEPESFYEISPRYHLSLTGAKYGGKTKTIPQEVLEALCADPDGCQVRLAMTRWSSDVQTESASVFFTFYYSASDGHWRASQTDASSASGIDGNNVIQHVRSAWDTCFFTDGTYSGYKEIGDDKKGMQLLVWKKFNHINRTCECTIID